MLMSQLQLGLQKQRMTVDKTWNARHVNKVSSHAISFLDTILANFVVKNQQLIPWLRPK